MGRPLAAEATPATTLARSARGGRGGPGGAGGGGGPGRREGEGGEGDGEQHGDEPAPPVHRRGGTPARGGRRDQPQRRPPVAAVVLDPFPCDGCHVAPR